MERVVFEYRRVDGSSVHARSSWVLLETALRLVMERRLGCTDLAGTVGVFDSLGGTLIAACHSQ